MKSTLLLAVLADVCVAVQTSLTGTAQRTLGPLVLVAILVLTTGVFALSISFLVVSFWSALLRKPRFQASGVRKNGLWWRRGVT